MSRALTSLPIVKPTSRRSGREDQGQLRLGHAPASCRRTRIGRPGPTTRLGRRLEEEFGPVGAVDQVVERPPLLRLLLAGHLAPLVGHPGPPDFLGIERGQTSTGSSGIAPVRLAQKRLDPASRDRRLGAGRSRRCVRNRAGGCGSPSTSTHAGGRVGFRRKLGDAHRAWVPEGRRPSGLSRSSISIIEMSTSVNDADPSGKSQVSGRFLPIERVGSESSHRLGRLTGRA